MLIQRCAWVLEDKPDYIDYHDKEWGVPVFDDQKLFEMLVLEGAQAGLNWYTILKRRTGYQMAFKTPEYAAAMSDGDLDHILLTGNIIRNRLKVYSVRQNAQVFLKIQEEFGSFSSYLWGFVGGTPIVNSPKTIKDVPASTSLSAKISKDLKKRGMTFVGPTIIYAYMQAVGMVNDHVQGCCCL